METEKYDSEVMTQRWEMIEGKQLSQLQISLNTDAALEQAIRATVAIL